MMISDKMCKALNEQVTNEFFAQQIYLSMSCMFDGKALKKLSEYFRKQAAEERDHGMKILDYILEQGGKVELQAVDAPPAEWPSVLAAVEAAVEHEKKVTGQVNDLCKLANEEKDYATRHFLGWFVDEQVEEVSSMQHLADVVKMCGNALLNIEAYLLHHG